MRSPLVVTVVKDIKRSYDICYSCVRRIYIHIHTQRPVTENVNFNIKLLLRSRVDGGYHR